MPRYRDRTVPSRISSPGPLAETPFDVTFTDGYAPETTDPDILSVHQGGVRTSALNEVGYFRGTWVTGHNSDAIFRAIETAGATGNAFELEDVTRTKRPFGIDAHTGAIKRYDVATSSLIALGPSDARPTDPAAGVAFIASSQFGQVPPEIFGVRMMTIDPNLCTLNRAFTSQDLWAVKVYCNADMTLTTMSTRVQTATAVTGSAGYNGYAIYSDGSTMNLLGSTPDDTTLFQSTGQKNKNLTTPVNLVGGNFYWFCMITNWTGTTLEVATSLSMGAAPGVTNSWPAGNTTARLATQTSFPSTITRSSMSGHAVRPCIAGY